MYHGEIVWEDRFGDEQSTNFYNLDHDSIRTLFDSLMDYSDDAGDGHVNGVMQVTIQRIKE